VTDADADRHPRDDPERLRELYHEGGLSIREIGEHFGLAKQTVRRWMQRHSINRRDPCEAVNTHGNTPPYDRAYRDPDYLRTAYWGRRQSTIEIARVFNVSPATVVNWMIKHDIPRRERKGESYASSLKNES